MQLYMPGTEQQEMQNGMPELGSMTAEQLQLQHQEVVHAGTKRRSPELVHSGDSDHDHQFFTANGTKVVQTTKSKGIVNVQLFIRKAFAMINECDPNIASWTDEGDKFVVKTKDVFAASVIPQYYDHNNYSSFTRQLNFYGFTREQSMTIKVSNLNSLAVGQETFYHQHFQRGRPDLLKNLQRRSSDTKNSKKRKKPRTAEAADVGFLQGRLENLEETTKEMLSTMTQMRDDNFAAAAAIQDLQSLNAAKDEKISTLEKRIAWLERRLNTNGAMQRQESYLNAGQHQRLLATTNEANTAAAAALNNKTAWPLSSTSDAVLNNFAAQAVAQQEATSAFLPTEVTFPTDNNPTLARHPKMKKFLGNPPRDIFSNPPRDIFSYENATSNISNAGAAPSRETSLDLGLFTSLARENTLLSWALPTSRPEDNANNNNINKTQQL